MATRLFLFKKKEKKTEGKEDKNQTAVTTSRKYFCPRLTFCQCMKTPWWRFTALGCSMENWFPHLAGSHPGHVIVQDVNNRQRDLLFHRLIHKIKCLTSIRCISPSSFLPLKLWIWVLPFTLVSTNYVFFPPPAQARTSCKSLMQIKVSPSAPRGFWWLIDLACATGRRGLSVWRRAAGTNQSRN